MHPKISHGLATVAILLIGCAPVNLGALTADRRLRLIQTPHIIEGQYVEIEDVPYQISLEVLTVHSCGGAIVSEYWVVTAASCIQKSLISPTWLKRIRAGSKAEIPVIGWGGTVLGIEETTSHPLYDPQTVDYDVGVIRVSGKFTFSQGIQAIVVPNQRETTFIDYTQTGTTSGWGISTEASVGWTSLWLKKVTLPLVPREQCAKLLEKEHFKVTTRMICGGGPGTGGASRGDSGGPLVHKNQLVGLISWTGISNAERLPTVFTNVIDPEIRGFIKENTEV